MMRIVQTKSATTVKSTTTASLSLQQIRSGRRIHADAGIALFHIFPAFALYTEWQAGPAHDYAYLFSTCKF